MIRREIRVAPVDLNQFVASMQIDYARFINISHILNRYHYCHNTKAASTRNKDVSKSYHVLCPLLPNASSRTVRTSRGKYFWK